MDIGKWNASEGQGGEEVEVAGEFGCNTDLWVNLRESDFSLSLWRLKYRSWEIKILFGRLDSLEY